MTKKWKVGFLAFLSVLTYPNAAQCDLFGGDVVVLSQLLINAVQQLSQLRSIVGAGQDSLGLLRNINQGINDSLSLIRTISPNTDPGLYSEWQGVGQAQQGIQSIYGTAVPSPVLRVQQDTDRNVAEAISRNNSIYKYTAQIDEIGERVKAYSHSTSPGGAQKLTAETLGVMLNVMNESLRTQATGLKLQAQHLAVQNHKDKEGTRQMMADSENLKTALKNEPVKFSIPRF